MYNKLFTKILDSSIWLAPDPHRLVWITLIAAMDRNGIAEFACAGNLALRARVSLEETEQAIQAFMSPDPHGPDQEFDGRRIERVPGGWFILNAQKYRELVTRAISNEKSKERMQRHREKLRNVTDAKRNGSEQPVTLRNDTPSVSVSVSNHQNPERAHDPVDNSAVSQHARPDGNGSSSTTPWQRAEKTWQLLVSSGGMQPARTQAFDAMLRTFGGYARIQARTTTNQEQTKREFCDAYIAAGL